MAAARRWSNQPIAGYGQAIDSGSHCNESRVLSLIASPDVNSGTAGRRVAPGNGRRKFRPDLNLQPEDGVAHWTARIVAMVLANCPGFAGAATHCDTMPKGPERTDCYLALSRSYQAQSDLAAARARAQADAAWYRAITGEDPPRENPRRRR